VWSQECASHTTFAILLAGTGSACALHTCRFLRIPLACAVLQNCDAIRRGAAAILAASCTLRTYPKRIPDDADTSVTADSSMIELLHQVRLREHVSGIASGGITDVTRQLRLACVCDAAGLKLVASEWAAHPPASLLAKACAEGRALVPLRVPASAISHVPSVVWDAESAWRLVDALESSAQGSSNPDSGLTEFLILPAGQVAQHDKIHGTYPPLTSSSTLRSGGSDVSLHEADSQALMDAFRYLLDAASQNTKTA